MQLIRRQLGQAQVDLVLGETLFGERSGHLGLIEDRLQGRQILGALGQTLIDRGLRRCR